MNFVRYRSCQEVKPFYKAVLTQSLDLKINNSCSELSYISVTFFSVVKTNIISLNCTLSLLFETIYVPGAKFLNYQDKNLH